ncbi:hypothetical protein LTR82_000996 [Friedmanniomyces endolithicus]|uniref:Uncharacterized protein n=1 Tax=Friedmanniomyces endolithicus TaxID=329885 RepID=A0AAN6JER6_9PEZI|nr:hypothetical protein LTR82_000996 [Friedmanniomyces endolithicus]
MPLKEDAEITGRPPAPHLRARSLQLSGCGARNSGGGAASLPAPMRADDQAITAESGGAGGLGQRENGQRRWRTVVRGGEGVSREQQE